MYPLDTNGSSGVARKIDKRSDYGPPLFAALAGGLLSAAFFGPLLASQLRRARPNARLGPNRCCARQLSLILQEFRLRDHHKEMSKCKKLSWVFHGLTCSSWR